MFLFYKAIALEHVEWTVNGPILLGALPNLILFSNVYIAQCFPTQQRLWPQPV